MFLYAYVCVMRLWGPYMIKNDVLGIMLGYMKLWGQTSLNVQDVRKLAHETWMCVSCYQECLDVLNVIVLGKTYVQGTWFFYIHIIIGNVFPKAPQETLKKDPKVAKTVPCIDWFKKRHVCWLTPHIWVGIDEQLSWRSLSHMKASYPNHRSHKCSVDWPTWRRLCPSI